MSLPIHWSPYIHQFRSSSFRPNPKSLLSLLCHNTDMESLQSRKLVKSKWSGRLCTPGEATHRAKKRCHVPPAAPDGHIAQRYHFYGFLQYPLVNIYITMENHHVQWVNPLFLWSLSIAMLNYQRVFLLEDLEPIAHNTRSLAQKTSPENLLQLLLPHAMRFIMNSSQKSAHCI